MTARTLRELLEKQHGAAQRATRARRFDWHRKVMGIDPGMTTGWVVFEHGQRAAGGQERTRGPAAGLAMERLIDQHTPAVIVCEQYTIYRWKQKEHVGSDMPVSRLIGAIELIAAKRGIRLVFQSAMIGKSWWSAARLKDVGLYRAGQPHQMDATRHACHWLLFGAQEKL